VASVSGALRAKLLERLPSFGRPLLRRPARQRRSQSHCQLGPIRDAADDADADSDEVARAFRDDVARSQGIRPIARFAFFGISARFVVQGGDFPLKPFFQFEKDGRLSAFRGNFVGLAQIHLTKEKRHGSVCFGQLELNASQ